MVTEIASDIGEYDRYGINFQSYKLKINWYKVITAYEFILLFFFSLMNEIWMRLMGIRHSTCKHEKCYL